MNQKAFLQRMDALAFKSFHGVGVADSARYIFEGAETPCTVLLDEDVQQFTDDDLAPIPVLFDRITLQLSEVSPRKGAVVRIVGSGRELKLIKPLRGDASTQQWEVADAKSP